MMMGLGCQKADRPNRGSSSSSSTPETGIPITAVLHRGEAYSSRKAIRFPCEIISNSESFFFFLTSVCVKAGEKYYIDDEDFFFFNDVYCILNRYIFSAVLPGPKSPAKRQIRNHYFHTEPHHFDTRSAIQMTFISFEINKAMIVVFF